MNQTNPGFETVYYDNKTVRDFALASVGWGLIGMIVGLLIALQLPLPGLNFAEQFSFGRLRPLHTNAVIFAFVGNAIFFGVYYSMPRLLKTPMANPLLSRLHFWGWQLIILLAAISYPLGITTSKEYAELEWPIDILITIVWVIFGLNMILTILKRREQHMYVAIWFYLASFIAVAILHVVNSLAIPVSLTKSYSVFAGVQDALVQWWYGHNAVAFFLTTPYLGLMYYFLPKASGRPIYSYRLSIIHFWSLVFIYIWAGPHHLLYTAVPGWAQSLGVVFSIMLIAPSWGGMLNGLLTLRGAWDVVRQDPILKFMVVAVTSYGMVTFEGPMMSLKSFNALVHYTDYIVGHVHNGALGWNGMLTFGILYWMIPRIYQTKLYSISLANAHFWLATLGMVLYVISMYFSGFVQGLMWKQVEPDGFLTYRDFLETVIHVVPLYWIRALGGAIYILGVFVMIYNLAKTMGKGKLLEQEPAQVPQSMVEFEGHPESIFAVVHRNLEKMPIPFIVATFVAAAAGGILELVPAVLLEKIAPTQALVTPYRPLELEGRDIYVREGCYTCHSQMVRPFISEKIRYGEPSLAGEFVYDHPFQWGSKRIGPDLHRVGGKYSHAWHYNHLVDPTSTSPGSIMPAYAFMADRVLDTSLTRRKLEVMALLGVPYTQETIDQALTDLKQQAEEIATDLQSNGIAALPDTEIIALIAYMQKLGVRIEEKK